jgi:hypothetical protein
MLRGKLSRPAWLALAVAVAVALLGVLGHRWARPSRGPRTLEEVARLAESLSLEWRSDREDGGISQRLVISEKPLTQARANLLCFGDPTLPCWRGTVAASTPWVVYSDHLGSGHAVVWGEVLLFGDPALIRKLTARPAEAAAEAPRPRRRLPLPVEVAAPVPPAPREAAAAAE